MGIGAEGCDVDGAPGCASSSRPRASPTMMSAALKLASTVLGRWIVQTLSCASTETPIVEPVTQWFGSGFGQYGSTSKDGASPGADFCAEITTTDASTIIDDANTNFIGASAPPKHYGS